MRTGQGGQSLRQSAPHGETLLFQSKRMFHVCSNGCPGSERVRLLRRSDRMHDSSSAWGVARDPTRLETGFCSLWEREERKGDPGFLPVS